MNENDVELEKSTEVLSDPQNTFFLRLNLFQNQRDHLLRQKELLSTSENPTIRNLNETREITEQLKASKHKEYIENKRRQQLRCNNLELRQLEKQLRSAYVSKQYDEQFRDLQKRKNEEEIQKRKENELLNLEQKRLLESDLEIEKQEQIKKTELRNVLLDQIKHMQDKRKEEYALVVKEREQMQQLMIQLQLEDEADRNNQLKQKKINHEIMLESKREKEEREKQRQAESRIGDNSMLQTLENYELKRQELRNKRIKEQQCFEAVSNSLGQVLLNTKKEKEKRENLLLDLLVEEKNTKEELRLRKELEEQEQQRDYIRNELQRHVFENRCRKERSKKLDIEYWLQETAKMNSEKCKDEKNKLEKKRNKALQYRRDIVQMMEERNIMRTIDAAEHRRIYENCLDIQRKEDEEVEKERIKLLQSYSPEVLKYLPRGVLRDCEKQIISRDYKTN